MGSLIVLIPSATFSAAVLKLFGLMLMQFDTSLHKPLRAQFPIFPAFVSHLHSEFVVNQSWHGPSSHCLLIYTVFLG